MPNLLSTLTLNTAPATEGSLTPGNTALNGEFIGNSEGSEQDSGFSLLLTQSLSQASSQLATWIHGGEGVLPGQIPTLPLTGNEVPLEETLELPVEALDTPVTMPLWSAALPVVTLPADAATLDEEAATVSLSLNVKGGKENPTQLLRQGVLATLTMGQSASPVDAKASPGPELSLVTEGGRNAVSLSSGKALDQLVSQLVLTDRNAGGSVGADGVTRRRTARSLAGEPVARPGRLDSHIFHRYPSRASRMESSGGGEAHLVISKPTARCAAASESSAPWTDGDQGGDDE